MRYAASAGTRRSRDAQDVRYAASAGTRKSRDAQDVRYAASAGTRKSRDAQDVRYAASAAPHRPRDKQDKNMITNQALANLVQATYQPIEQHPHASRIEATLTTEAFGVGQLRADILTDIEDQDLLIIAIRGSANNGNWLANIDARKVNSTILISTDGSDQAQVHAGFARASETLTPAIQEAIPAGKRVIITGHSLGAAIALFVAPRLVQAGITVDRVVTFGCPRVGDANYLIDWTDRVGPVAHRYVNGPDPVCQLPTPLRGFRHIGKLHWHSYQGDALQAGAWMRFGNRLGAYWHAWRNPGADLIGYHAMRSYTALLSD